MEEWFQPVRKQRLAREISEDTFAFDDEKWSQEKRSFSHTSLPLPSRIQFMLKVKNAFCIQQKDREKICMRRAIKKAIKKKQAAVFDKFKKT